MRSRGVGELVLMLLIASSVVEGCDGGGVTVVTDENPNCPLGSNNCRCTRAGTCDPGLNCDSNHVCLGASNTGGNGTGGTPGGGNTGTAGTPGGGSPGTCAMPGNTCSASTTCCSGSTCINDRVNGVIVCASECSAPNQCNSGCCTQLTNSATMVCAPTSYCAAPPPPPPPPPPSGCGRLILVANDAKFIGLATSDRFATNSVCNEFGPYGSQFSQTSIFNQFGSYGDKFSALSAYNQFSSTPPAIYCENSRQRQVYVTKNTILSPALDPDGLCLSLRNAGL